MIIAFYINEMNFRGVANSTFQYALYNQKILKNRSIVFYNKNNHRNRKEVINKFKKKFKTFGVSSFKEIEDSKIKNINFIYVQKGGEKDNWVSNKIKTLVHTVYPQKLNQIHGFKYALISKWLSKEFYNFKVPYVPYIVEMDKTKKNLNNKLKIKKNFTVIGCHGGESSFDMQFTKDVIEKVVNNRDDLVFLFLNINKFCNHARIKFLKGTSDESYKKKFINTCDAMLYGRSLGESFGLACAEFSIQGKKIFSYKFNRHRSHILENKKDIIEEYSSFKNLYQKLIQFKKKKFKKSINSTYKNYTSKKVMKEFKKVFLQKKKPQEIGFTENAINFYGHFSMGILYLKHKIYNHYYRLIEKNLFNKNI